MDMDPVHGDRVKMLLVSHVMQKNTGTWSRAEIGARMCLQVMVGYSFHSIPFIEFQTLSLIFFDQLDLPQPSNSHQQD